MDREYLEMQIENLKKNIELSKENIKSATNHVEEGQLILKTFEKKLKELS